MQTSINLIAAAVAFATGGAAFAQSAQEAPILQHGGMGQPQIMGQMRQGPMMTPEMRRGMTGMMQNCRRMMSRMGSEGVPVSRVDKSSS